MKKIIILLLAVITVQSLSAQSRSKRPIFSFQASQHFGLNEWSDVNYVNQGAPRRALTDLKASISIPVATYYGGLFSDIGVGIMPASKMNSFNTATMPMPHSGREYLLREVVSENGMNGASAHFKMTFGLFGRIPVSDNMTIMPYAGIGFITMQGKGYNVLLKEKGTNREYRATYSWSAYDEYNSDSELMGYLSARVNFTYKLSGRKNLILGVEYMRYLDTYNFTSEFTNIYNAGNRQSNLVEGNYMNMFGVTLGIAFMK